jgi:aminobenzoyl-glutamate utilization protein B
MAEVEPEKQDLSREIESRQEKFWKISDAIWSYAELGWQEFKSSKLLGDTLEQAGFRVDREVAGMPTAFAAAWSSGTGRPVIGFLAEYDALPMLSQKAGAATHDPVVQGAPGHGCSHNTMGTMQTLSVIALKSIMMKTGINGTLKLFGCPAEEVFGSRPYMIRAGLFKDVDVVIDCHGDGQYRVAYGVEGNAAYSFIINFRGKTAHAAGEPWRGRSALDAVELMHAGTERMREHLPTSQRTHWIITEGGEAPNVVPDRAGTWYFIRDNDEQIEEIFKWVLDCARAAALMTQTTYELKLVGAIHQRFSNRALAELIYENIKLVGKPQYTASEEAYAKALQQEAGMPAVKGLDYGLALTNPETFFRASSSDVGDVTLVAPTASFRFPVRVPGSASHHWAVTSAAASSIAHKGISAGAKVTAFSAYDLLTKSEVLPRIKQEFEELAQERPYKSFLPEGAEPFLTLNSEIMEKYRAAMEPFYIEP